MLPAAGTSESIILDFLVIKYEESAESKSISLGRKRLLMAEKVPHVRLTIKNHYRPLHLK